MELFNVVMFDASTASTYMLGIFTTKEKALAAFEAFMADSKYELDDTDDYPDGGCRYYYTDTETEYNYTLAIEHQTVDMQGSVMAW